MDQATTGSGLRIERLTCATEDALRILNLYYEEIQVVLRDTAEKVTALVQEPKAGLWMAYINEKAVGCLMMRGLAGHPDAGECKRLYVLPEARGHHIADQLFDALEEYAREIGLEWLYLDSKEDLLPALKMYVRRGFHLCERYNENPQATVFMRKRLEKA